MGRLWFPTSQGIAEIDPVYVYSNPYEPQVVIEEMSVNGKTLEPGELQSGTDGGSSGLQIEPGQQRFMIRSAALSFDAPKKVRFKYKLEGFDHDWSEPSAERETSYSYLPPGTYAFRVKACNNDNVWNEQGASLTFTVLPRFYQTWFFQVAMVMLGAAAGGAGVMWISRRRIRRRLEQLERQRAVERERARIARDIHDDLGASLTRISMLSQSVRSEVDSVPQAAEDIDRIYSTARELTRAMDEIVWAVNPKHDTLDSLVTYLGRYAQHFVSSASIRCRIDVPLHLPAWSLTAEIRHNLFLAFKEGLNNALKHAQASEVRIALELEKKGFTLLVADNGRGFDVSQFEAGAVDERNGFRGDRGNGLGNMRLRLEEIGGSCEWETAPGEGTRVRFRVRLNAHSLASSKDTTTQTHINEV
jgi:signal transduction histidine kinase